ncbi:hypothetical protein A3844_11560 [Paenibacillus helianthi]|uniref:Glycine zipper family protein n=1 Tax=Paenibacillus helianthi TaxID=1349432 RepID=A0ABX3EQV2_9BACL|nr:MULTISPECIES: hypothetical protein [Paenibacillus]OKP86654.1 hypothetical protein A3844_11560 [Paenibacillus helianthi]OKP91506.1 hypothetical protein A3842_02870 [Paenibacillus sp. P3E]
MPEHKNLLRRIVYDEPFSKTCYKKVLGVKVPYPCFGMKRKKIEIYLVTKYPEQTTPVQKAAILSCAKVASSVALAAFKVAYAATVGSTGGIGAILGGVAAGIAAAETAGKKSFDECKKKSLPNDIARQTGISIRQEKSNRSYEIHTDNEISSAITQLSHYNHHSDNQITSPYPYANYNQYQYPYTQTTQRDEVYYNLSSPLSDSSPIYIEYPEIEEEVSEIETFNSADDDNYFIEQ